MTTELVQQSKPSFGVTFTKKVSDGNYGGEEVSVWVSADVDLLDSDTSKYDALSDATKIAKAVAFDQLGLLSEPDEQGILRVVASVPKQSTFKPVPGRTNPQHRDDDGPQYGNDTLVKNVRIKGKAHGEIPTWLIEAAGKAGVTEVWDNREKVADPTYRGPWFRCVLDRDKAFWPPRSK